MKKMLTALAILALSAGFAGANTYIGMFAQPHATGCAADTDVFTTTTVHFIVWMDTDFTGQVSAAEFYVENWPETAGMGVITFNWATPLTIGFIEHGLALAFADPLQGPLAYLGSVDFFPTDAGWIGTDYHMYVRPSRASDTLAIVDEAGVTFPVDGGLFTFNCSVSGPCDCLESVAVDDADYSSVKALY